MERNRNVELMRGWAILVTLGYHYCVTSGIAVPVSQWSHVAVTRRENTFTLWINGASVGTASSTLSITSRYVSVGGQKSQSSYFSTGYIDELRISKGVARWTSNFTPPTAPYASALIRFAQVF